MKADLTPYLIDGFLPTIGIECHVQLRTKTKLFAAVAAEGSLQSDANSSVSPLCLGLPGALPVLNEAAVDLAISAGLALQAEIAPETSFDRKHTIFIPICRSVIRSLSIGSRLSLVAVCVFL